MFVCIYCYVYLFHCRLYVKGSGIEDKITLVAGNFTEEMPKLE